MLISSETVVLLTLAYADQFNFPLSEVEIYQRLVKISLSRDTFKKILISLKKNGLIESQGQFWKLKNGKAQNKSRLERELYSQEKWSEVDELIKAISWIPWIKGVAITGSLAVNNVTPDGDIDLMIAVAPRRLWLTRILVSTSALWAGKRRTWQGSEENSWCFNLWLDKNNLSLPRRKRNLYSAYEVCQSKWVLDRDNIEKKFYQNNYWVKNFLPNYFDKNYKKAVMNVVADNNEYVSAPILRFVGRRFLDILNLFIFTPQYLYMYPHMSREKVSLDAAYFHPRSTRGYIYQGWLASLKRLAGNFRRVVLVTGVFDLFHQEHQNFLRKAKAEGDLLIVGIETDERVRNSKGNDRPIDDQQKRLQQLQLFPVVDLAFVLPAKFETDEEHLALLKLIRPQVLAVSSHTPFLKKKQQLMEQVGGKLKIVYKENSEVSTTRLKKML